MIVRTTAEITDTDRHIKGNNGNWESKRIVLADDVVVEERSDLAWVRHLVERQLAGLGELFFDDLVAEIDALVTDVDAGTGDQLLDLLLRLAAERTLQQFAGVTEFRHLCRPLSE